MTPPAFIDKVRKAVEGKEIFEEQMQNPWVIAYKDIAVVWAPFEGKEGNRENVRTWTGIDSISVMKVDGRWKISQIVCYQDRPEASK